MQVIFILAIISLIVSTIGSPNPYDNEGREEEYEEIDSWIPPPEFKKEFPYFHAGYDYDGQPVWVFEFWKWNYKKLVTEGPIKMQQFEKYANQLRYRIYNSPKYVPKNLTEDELHTVDRWVGIANWDGFDLSQLVNFKALQLMFKMLGETDVVCENMDYAFFINANFIAERFMNTLKPILGKALAKTFVRGTRRDKWLPQILQKIPKENLPPEYGGWSNYTAPAFPRETDY